MAWRCVAGSPLNTKGIVKALVFAEVRRMEVREVPDPVIEQQTDAVIRVTLCATGSVGLIGVHFSGDPGGVDPQAKKGVLSLPLGQLWEKGISVEMGQAPVKRYNAFLRDLIVQGQVAPGKLVSHTLSLEDGPVAYRTFVLRGDAEGAEFTKIILKPKRPGPDGVGGRCSRRSSPPWFDRQEGP
jgi:hypothetical protein